MTKELLNLLSGEIMEENMVMTLAELCSVCEMTEAQVIELVEHGVVEPQGSQPPQWRFHGISIRRIRRAQRLERDLGVNTAGAALALDLLEELEELRMRLARLED
jgi:chaperone modulatory protein CbpM